MNYATELESGWEESNLRLMLPKHVCFRYTTSGCARMPALGWLLIRMLLFVHKPKEGVEPSSTGWKPVVLPLNDSGGFAERGACSVSDPLRPKALLGQRQEWPPVPQGDCTEKSRTSSALAREEGVEPPRQGFGGPPVATTVSRKL